MHSSPEPLASGTPLKPKPNGRIAVLETQIAQLREDFNLLTWLSAESQHKQKMTIAAQILQDLLMLQTISGASQTRPTTTGQGPQPESLLQCLINGGSAV